MKSADTSSRAALLLVVGRGMGSVLTLAIPMVLARMFDPHAFGTYKQVMLVYTTVLLMAPFGVAESLFYFVPQDSRRAGARVANAIVFLVAAGLLVFGGLSLAGGPLSRWLGNPELAGHASTLGLFAGLSLGSTVLEILLISRGRYASAAASYALSDLARSAAFIVPILLVGGLEALLWGGVAFAALRLGTVLAVGLHAFGGGFRPETELVRSQLAYAIPFGAAAALAIAQSSYHHYAVAHAFDAAAFAVYSVGCLQIPMIDLVAGSAGNVLMVRMGESREDPGASRALWRAATAKLTSILVPLVGWLLLAAPALIEILYTSLYHDSVPVFRIWCLTTVLAAFQVDAVLRVQGRTRFLFVMYAVRLGLVAVAIGPLIRALSLPGAALATVMADSVVKGWALVKVSRLLGLTLRTALPWRQVARVGGATAAALASGLVAARVFVPDSHSGSVAALAVGSAAYGAVFLFVTWVLGEGGGPVAARSWVRAAFAGDLRTG